MKIEKSIIALSAGIFLMSSVIHGVIYNTLESIVTAIPELKIYITNATEKPIVVRQVRASGDTWIGLSATAKEVIAAPSQEFKDELVKTHTLQPNQTIDLYMANGKYNDFVMGYAGEESGTSIENENSWDKGFINNLNTAAHWAQGNREHWLVVFACNNENAVKLLKDQYGSTTILLTDDYTPGRVRVRCTSLGKLNTAVFDGHKKNIAQLAREITSFIYDLKSAAKAFGQLKEAFKPIKL